MNLCPKCSEFQGTICSFGANVDLLKCLNCGNVWEVIRRFRESGELANLRQKIVHLEESCKNWEKLFGDEMRKRGAQLENMTKGRDYLHKQSETRLAECDVLREENRRLMEINKKLGEQNEQVTHKFECLEKYANGDIFVLKEENRRLIEQNKIFLRSIDEKNNIIEVLRCAGSAPFSASEENRRLLDANLRLSKENYDLETENKNLVRLLDESTKSGIASDNAWSSRYTSRGEEIKRLQAQIEELESFRKLSGEYATLAKRDAIREANKRLQQENQQHAQQIKALQADLNAAHLRNITQTTLEEHEAAWCINWQNKVRKLKGDITILEAARDHFQTESDNWRIKHNELFDDNERLKNARDNWEKTAEQEFRNNSWLRNILDAIGGFFGDAAKTNDVGEVTDGIFYSKLPKLVEDNLVFRMSPDPRVVELKKQIERAREALAGVHHAVNHSEKFLKGFKL